MDKSSVGGMSFDDASKALQRVSEARDAITKAAKGDDISRVPKHLLNGYMDAVRDAEGAEDVIKAERRKKLTGKDKLAAYYEYKARVRKYEQKRDKDGKFASGGGSVKDAPENDPDEMIDVEGVGKFPRKAVEQVERETSGKAKQTKKRKKKNPKNMVHVEGVGDVPRWLVEKALGDTK